MAIYRLELNKKLLLEVPEDERNLFFAIAHLQNEIGFSINSVAWSKFVGLEDKNEMEGQIALNFFYLKILAGKLHEGWQLLNKYLFSNKELSLYFNEKSKKDGLECLKRLKKYFSKANAVSNIRNELSFHYNPTELSKHLDAMKDNLSLYLSDENLSNTIYYFAEALSSWAALSKFSNSQNKNPLKIIVEELIEVAGDFSIFNMNFMKVIINKYNPDIWKDVGKEIKITGLRHFKDIRIPAFVDTSKGYI